jgi:Predicted choline kinase involved in LPS biosynthesis
MPDALATTLRLVTAWAGCEVGHTVIKGGLSHHIARVDSANGERWVLRVLNPRISAAGLGIPLEQEIANTKRAAEAGVGARVLHELPGALLLEYIDGRTLDIDAVRDPELTPGIAAACRRLHRGPRFVNDFSIFRKLDELLGLCRRHGLPLPAGYEDCLPLVAEIEEALARRPMPAVPCHNDLLAENFLLADGRVRIVDYQLSGNNDPAFELGDIAAEADYDPDQVARLVRAYLDEASPDAGPAPIVAGIDPGEFTARARLYLIMSNFTWTLWFAIHHGLVQRPSGEGGATGEDGAAGEDGSAGEHADGRPYAGFDYQAEAADKFRQAVRDLNDPDFGRLIDAVRAPYPPATRKEA